MSRNVVLVTYDSLRADHCGFMGYGRDTTPTLDRLAAQGTVFSNAVASGVPTIASMTGVMTGRHSLASPEIGFDRAQREQVTSRRTLAEVLSAAGYSTGGLSPNPPASSYFGFDQGFDWFEDFLDQDRGVFERAWNRVFRRSIRGGSLSTYLRLFRNVVQREEVLRPWEDYYDHLLDWRASVEEPYFLWVLLLDTHHPWLPPAEGRRWSSQGDVFRSFRHYWQMLDSGWEPDFTPTQHRRLVDLYDDSIRYGDRFLARLWSDLREDDPVFVVHSDHGEEFGEHGRYGHQPYLYETLTHVPLVVADAREVEEHPDSGRQTVMWDASAEGTVTRPVGLRSLAATVTDIADVHNPFPTPSAFDDDANRPWALSKVFAEGSRRVAVRTERYKYIDSPGRRELYNLAADPGETRDLVEFTPDLADQLGRLVDADALAEDEQRAVSDAVDDCARGVEL